MALRLALLCIAVVAVAEGKKWECEDYTEASNPGCFGNVTWAMSEGKANHSDWYPTGTETFADFQCALFLKKGDEWAGPAHNCLLPPCTPVSASMTSKGSPPHYLQEVKDCKKPEEEPSFPWWGWVLVAVGVLSLAVIGALVAMQMNKKAPKKKKRALKPQPAPEPKPEPVETKVEPLPTYQMVYTAPPVMTAAPVYAAPAPVVTAAPLGTVSMPAPAQFVAAAPVATYARPSSFVIPQQ
jgi:hypothetical protein